MNRLSLEQKISDVLQKDSALSLSFYGGKYNAIYTDGTYIYTAKSKSLSRAMSELGKFFKK